MIHEGADGKHSPQPMSWGVTASVGQTFVVEVVSRSVIHGLYQIEWVCSKEGGCKEVRESDRLVTRGAPEQTESGVGLNPDSGLLYMQEYV